MKNLLLLAFLVFGTGVSAETVESCFVQVEMTGSIGPATLDLLKRSRVTLERERCSARVILLNTPGGSLQSTRLIVEEILNEPFPTACLVTPAGAHAGSAGAIILQACHLSGATRTTHLGAASPVAGGGQEISEDMRKKLFNDTRSWVEGLAKLRKRNVDFAKDIIDDAKSVTAEEALKLKAIEVVVSSVDEFLEFARKFKFKIKDEPEKNVEFGQAIVTPLDLRFRVMQLLMSPEIAYLILMGSLGLLYFELTHPGVMAPGVIGGIGLIVSLMSLHMLEVQWGGVLLILVGIALMIAETFVAGFGILGLGGVGAFFMGSLFLFDQASGYSLPLSLVLPTTLLLGAFMILIAYLAFTARKRRTHAGFDDLIHSVGVVAEVDNKNPKVGLVEIDGETWRVESKTDLSIGESVSVNSAHGLTLYVQSKKGE